jgi:hypothetical protein
MYFGISITEDSQMPNKKTNREPHAKRLGSWKGKPLYFSGRLFFINSVLSDMVPYIISNYSKESQID